MAIIDEVMQHWMEAVTTPTPPQPDDDVARNMIEVDTLANKHDGAFLYAAAMKAEALASGEYIYEDRAQVFMNRCNFLRHCAVISRERNTRENTYAYTSMRNSDIHHVAYQHNKGCHCSECNGA